MGVIHGVWQDGRIIPEGPVDWPEGCRLRIEPETEPVPPGTLEDQAEDGSDSPEAIADWLAWYDSLEPLVFTPAEEADLRDWRRRIKEYTIAHMNDGIEGGRE
jgi:hypothetical protein